MAFWWFCVATSVKCIRHWGSLQSTVYGSLCSNLDKSVAVSGVVYNLASIRVAHHAIAIFRGAALWLPLWKEVAVVIAVAVAGGQQQQQQQPKTEAEEHEKLLQLQLLALQNANILHKENISTCLFSLKKKRSNKMWQHQSFAVVAAAAEPVATEAACNAACCSCRVCVESLVTLKGLEIVKANLLWTCKQEEHATYCPLSLFIHDSLYVLPLSSTFATCHMTHLPAALLIFAFLLHTHTQFTLTYTRFYDKPLFNCIDHIRSVWLIRLESRRFASSIVGSFE